jgi:hypothetical protein
MTAHRFAWQNEQTEQDTDEAYEGCGESVCASDQKHSNEKVGGLGVDCDSKTIRELPCRIHGNPDGSTKQNRMLPGSCLGGDLFESLRGRMPRQLPIG